MPSNQYLLWLSHNYIQQYLKRYSILVNTPNLKISLTINSFSPSYIDVYLQTVRKSVHGTSTTIIIFATYVIYNIRLKPKKINFVIFVNNEKD